MPPLVWQDRSREVLHALASAVDAIGPGREPPAMLLVSLDSFNWVTYNLGLGEGDRIVAEVLRTLSEAVGQRGLAAQLDRDEFAVLLENATVAEARRLAGAIQRGVRGIDAGRSGPILSVSIGVRGAEAGQPANEIIREAGVALDAAKAEGRGLIKVFEPFMLHALQIHRTIVTDLADAIREGRIGVVYQPIVDLHSGRIEGVEVLSRWTHPALGPVRPDEFIPLAESLGVAGELDRHVLRRALAQLKVWQESLDLPDDFTVSVNITPAELQHFEFIEQVRHALDDAGVQPKNLTLELTEASFVAGDDVDAYSLHGLRRLGVGLDIDDFGTGYSSISYLRRLPVTRAKIDRSLLGDLVEDVGQRRFLNAVVNLVAACGLTTVIEGIETAEQAQILRRLGATSGQGYYFSRPIPGEAMTQLLVSGLPPDLLV
ncbi:putative bifunctional diguanylate cyclase/phosphodiesterase [Sinomonas susongensis]|uniref:putative bifunctional diguanylate cyclase/phosphodiesterase n=1 Tax=Sinomonas susongensis TaxID=1324851 RepID=UPI0011080E85|nr:bifunctional diguanylate cyclase/phosphodiesterase [Sinomonas susongensis]